MYYSDKVLKALQIAFEAHAGQVDKSGYPYILHPLHLAESFFDEDSVVVALLHDVVEDTSVTLDDLKKAGFDDRVVQALSLLTHRKDLSYAEYVDKIKEDPLARRVKIADLKHNCDERRGGVSPALQRKKEECYYPSLETLLKAEGALRGKPASCGSEQTIGGATVLIQDKRLSDGSCPLVDYLKKEGFEEWRGGGSIGEAREFLYVNLENKTYALGRQGVRVTAFLCNKAISIDEFLQIYRIFYK